MSLSSSRYLCKELHSWKMKIFFLLLLLYFFSNSTVFACATRVEPISKCNRKVNVSASVCNQYYECVSTWFFFTTDWFWELKTCPNEQVFSSTEGQCVIGSCSTIVKQNLKCSSQDKPIATSCFEFYKCVSISFWFFTEWLWKLETCSGGEIFNSASGKCEPGSCTGSVEIQQNSECNGKAKLPSLLCNQYYECMGSWYIPWSVWTWKIQICPDGEIYDAETEECRLGLCSITTSSATSTDSTTSINDKGTTNTELFAKVIMSAYSTIVEANETPIIEHKSYDTSIRTRTTIVEMDPSDPSANIDIELSQTTNYNALTSTLIRRIMTQTARTSTDHDNRKPSHFQITEADTCSHSTTDSITISESTELVNNLTTVIRLDNSIPSISSREICPTKVLILLFYDVVIFIYLNK